MSDACATCATTYDRPQDPISQKPLLPGRELECCKRSICVRCLNQNKRYETYCPYCQITTTPSLLPQGLRDPPPYSAADDRIRDDDPPAYSSHLPVEYPVEKTEQDQDASDVLHFLTPNDTIHSLALAYGVPINALRRTNSLYSDHLLQARKTVLIPGEFYKGRVSLSPEPIEGEEDEIRKTKIRRWMVACKVAEYDVALLYLKQSEWNLESAITAYRDDEQWEKEHPIEARKRTNKGKNAKDVGMRRFVGSSRCTNSGT